MGKRIDTTFGPARAGRRLLGCLLACCLLVMLAGSAGADGDSGTAVGYPEQRIQVRLDGATTSDGLQLFQYLLGRVGTVRGVEPVSLHIEPDAPAGCRARWIVTSSGDAAMLAGQLLAIIKQLDPGVQNEVLYESPFIVTEGDLALVKRVEAVTITSDSVYFSIGIQTSVSGLPDDHPRTRGVNRWNMLPGAGFD